MRLSKLAAVGGLLVVLVFSGWLLAQPQDAEKKEAEKKEEAKQPDAGVGPASDDEDEPPFEVRVYDVSDAFLGLSNYPAPQALPEPKILWPPGSDTEPGPPEPAGGFGGGGGGLGGGGGGGGGRGGGMILASEKVTPKLEAIPSANVDPENLIDVLFTTIEPDQWEENGGNGSAELHGSKLIVYHTAAIHEKVAEFIRDLNQRAPKLEPVRTRFLWILVDEETAHRYIVGKPVPSEQLKADLEGSLHFVAETVCQPDQTVHVSSGDQMFAVTGRTPVVGPGGAYTTDPKIQPMQLGITLTVRVSIEESRASALLHVDAMLADGVQAGQAAPLVSQIKLAAAPLDTSVHLPIGKPVTAMRASFRPNDPGDIPTQIVLIAQVFLEK